jgi:2-haloacid dehalogenase
MAPRAPLEGIDACVFDAYGTLFDFSSAAARCSDTLGDRVDELAAVWRTKQIEYTWLRSLMGAYVDFWKVTGDALDYALETLDLNDPALRIRLMDLYQQLDAFPETKSVLTRLASMDIRMAILSNGSPAMLEAAVTHAGLGRLFEAVLSADATEIYKPHHSVYQLAVDQLSVPAERICFLSSNAWDAHGAAHFGFKVVWVNRYGRRRERLPGAPVHEIDGLAELPALLSA